MQQCLPTNTRTFIARAGRSKWVVRMMHNLGRETGSKKENLSAEHGYSLLLLV